MVTLRRNSVEKERKSRKKKRRCRKCDSTQGEQIRNLDQEAEGTRASHTLYPHLARRKWRGRAERREKKKESRLRKKPTNNGLKGFYPHFHPIHGKEGLGQRERRIGGKTPHIETNGSERIRVAKGKRKKT